MAMKIKNMDWHIKEALILLAGLVVISAVYFQNSSPLNAVPDGEAVNEAPAINKASQILARHLYLEALSQCQALLFSEAARKLQLSLVLWPDFVAARIRLGAVDKMRRDLFDDIYKNGLIDFKSLHYRRAVDEWLTALSLLDRHDSLEYKKLQQNIMEAQARAQERDL